MNLHPQDWYRNTLCVILVSDSTRCYMRSLKLVLAVLLCIIFVPAGAQTNTDLSIELSVAEDSITAGDSVTINIIVENSGSLVATNPIVTVQMPESSSNFSSAECMQVSPLALQCELAEIGVGESSNVTLTAVLNRAGNQLITTVIEADNLLGGSESNRELLSVQAQSDITQPVDLVVTASANGDNEISASGVGYIVTVVRNADQSNTAYFPQLELVVSEGLEFISGDYCSASNETVICRLPALAPQSETELIIAVAGNELVANTEVRFVASSSQPEVQAGDNEASVIFDVVVREVLCGASNPQCFTDGTGGTNIPDSSNEPVGEQPNGEPSTSAANNSGGGAISMKVSLWILLLLCSSFICNRYRV